MRRATRLVTGGHATHYWEETGIIGKRFETALQIDGHYAWDVWMVYRPGTRWEGEVPPKPDFAMQQLRRKSLGGMERLDMDTFVTVVKTYLDEKAQ